MKPIHSKTLQRNYSAMSEEPQKPYVPYPTGCWLVLLRLPLQLYALGLGNLVGLMPFMVLTTRGTRSGLARHAVLEYRRHGSKYYVLSMWGARPSWYQNLLSHPVVTLQLGGKEIAARAVPVTDAQEAARAVYRFRKNSLVYAELLARISSAEDINLGTLVDVSGEFTVVRFDPINTAPEISGIRPTRWWITAIVTAILGVGLVSWRQRHNDK
jgi:deazaflavin-dependent oxidoreductase (nitroreductase family)